jgi:hypothetical protein
VGTFFSDLPAKISASPCVKQAVVTQHAARPRKALRILIQLRHTYRRFLVVCYSRPPGPAVLHERGNRLVRCCSTPLLDSILPTPSPGREKIINVPRARPAHHRPGSPPHAPQSLHPRRTQCLYRAVCGPNRRLVLDASRQHQ